MILGGGAATGAAPSVRASAPPGRLRHAVLIGWGIAALVLTVVSARAIAQLWFPDPDDAMRLLEVRDWLGGQSWWDVGQHRLGGGRFAMHWSRLVDLPLAAVMLVADPLVGAAASTRIAMTVVPLLTLLAAMALAAGLTRRLAGFEVGQRAVLLLPLSVPIVYQIRPVRIDHHGWQIVLALAAVFALLSVPTRRSGALAGAALAALLTVSLEGMPISAAIASVAMLGWALDPSRREQALALVATLFVGVVALHVATRGPGLFVPACDAISPPWIAALGIACAGAGFAMLMSPATAAARLALLALAGGAALLTLYALAPGCTRGPFATLDPLVYRLWFQNVSEGLPVWQQVPAWAVMTVAFPIVGLIGAGTACARASGEARVRWIMMLGIAGAAFALSLLVMRAGATANALTLPGGAWLLDAMLARARAIGPVPVRTAATAGALMAATPGLAATVLFGVQSHDPTPDRSSGVGRAVCDHGHEIADLARLPQATMFAPLDVTPALLALTPHGAIAGGYHRNAEAIHRVLATFMAEPDAAHRLIAQTGAAYVVGCPGENETEIYKKEAPTGLWARLERGERIAWLQPVPIPGSPVLAWRIVQPQRR
jgi:hypothetical protein